MGSDLISADVLVDPGTAFSLAGVIYVLLALAAGLHVVINKRNEAAALTWLGIIVLSPYFGAIIYWLFGINRIQRRAAAELPGRAAPLPLPCEEELPAVALEDAPRWQTLMRLGRAIHHENYEAGNHIEPLINGDQAYPAMLQAIESAEYMVVLSSYIFEYDAAGKQFVAALAAAHARGVAVRVLIDGLGVGYGFSVVRADRVLRSHGVSTARFLSTFSATGTRFINLRNHRKILSVDGRVAFVGGINIRAGNMLNKPTRHATQDVHFCVRGPVIDQIQAVFADDWEFASSERLVMPRYAAQAAAEASIDMPPSPASAQPQVRAQVSAPASAQTSTPARKVLARVLLDGPDDNYQKLQLTMVSAINAARDRICIATPYFIPDRTVVHALQLAALRGVRVDIIVPSKNNIPFVDWAMQANEARLLSAGIRLYKTPPPFDHSKLFLVDRHWSLIGSSNWDARSLELNFEINLECYDDQFNAQLDAIVDHKLAGAHRVYSATTPALPALLRNNFCRLFSPYL